MNATFINGEVQIPHGWYRLSPDEPCMMGDYFYPGFMPHSRDTNSWLPSGNWKSNTPQVPEYIYIRKGTESNNDNWTIDP